MEQSFNDAIDPLTVVATQSLRSHLLTKTGLPFLIEAKIATGFSSHAHLSATFRQRLGISSSRLRRVGPQKAG